MPGFVRNLLQFKVEIWFQIFPSRGKTGQFESPKVDSSQQVFSKTPLLYSFLQIAIRPGDELKITLHLVVSTDGEKSFFLNRTQQHRLFIKTQFTDLIQKQQAAIRRHQQARPIDGCSCEGPFYVSKQGGHGLITSQSRTVDFHKAAGQLFSPPFQFKDAAGQTSFPGASGARDQHRASTCDCDLLDLFDQSIEDGIASFNAGLQKR